VRKRIYIGKFWNWICTLLPRWISGNGFPGCKLLLTGCIIC